MLKMETQNEAKDTQLLVRAGVDLSNPDYVDTDNLLNVIRRLQTRLDEGPQPTKVQYTYERVSDANLMVGNAKIMDLIQHYIGGFGVVKTYEAQ